MSYDWSRPSIYLLADDMEEAASGKRNYDDDDDETHPLAYLNYYNTYEEDDD